MHCSNVAACQNFTNSPLTSPHSPPHPISSALGPAPGHLLVVPFIFFATLTYLINRLCSKPHCSENQQNQRKIVIYYYKSAIFWTPYVFNKSLCSKIPSLLYNVATRCIIPNELQLVWNDASGRHKQVTRSRAQG